jgi:serpin B
MLSLLPTLALTLPFTPATPPEVQAVLTANNQFALDLYRQLRTGEGNLFFSPYCIDKALCMVHAGARGDTAEEMARVLHFTLEPQHQHRAFREARQLLNAPAERKPWGFRLGRGKAEGPFHLSANLWGQQGCSFEKSFLNLLRECYGAGLREVNFADGETARQTINGWAESETDHRIRDLFPPGVLNRTTRLVLASAIYFKGDWVHPFDRDQTRKAAFGSSAADEVKAPLMKQTETFGYFENEELQVLQMPYQGKKLALVVLLPRKRDGLPDLEKTLTAEGLTAWLGGLREQKVDVALPKFKLTAPFDLKEALSAMGMKKAFLGGVADFGGMNGGRESLYLSAVLHKAFVDVNEEGTEAAAATGAAMATLSAGAAQPRVPVFRADHPFAFAIRDVPTGAILFLGRLVRP